MRVSFAVIKYVLLLVGLLSATGGAAISVWMLERATQSGLTAQMQSKGLTWVKVDTDGLQVFIYGTAPDETARFAALSAAGAMVDSARIMDSITVEDAEGVQKPKFSIQALRSRGAISLVGLIPAQNTAGSLLYRAGRIEGPDRLTDLLEVADYPAPPNWDEAMGFVISALEDLPQSKIDLREGRVTVTATAPNANAAGQIRRQLRSAAPQGYTLSLNIRAPRAIISPYTARITAKDGALRFDACTALNDAEQSALLNAAIQVGMTNPSCAIGLGRPDADWSRAVITALDAMTELQNASLTFSDRSVLIVGGAGQDPDAFTTATAKLQNSLPAAYTLDAIAPRAVTDGTDPNARSFIATRSPEGLVQLRGDIGQTREFTLIETFARARFGGADLRISGAGDDTLPRDWGMKVLLALDALGYLENGLIELTDSALSLRGRTYDGAVRSQIVALLDDRLGGHLPYDLNINVVDRPTPEETRLTPSECLRAINGALGDRKIGFEPGSARLNIDGRAILDDIADALRDCPELPLEIGGHTDSQGREVMNEQLSKARAETIISELRARRILTQSFRAVGYGESRPIADNDTEEGREENRRIEFTIYQAQPVETPADDSPTAPDQPEATPTDEPAADAVPNPQPTEDPAGEPTPASTESKADAPAPEQTDAAPEPAAQTDQPDAQAPAPTPQPAPSASPGIPAPQPRPATTQ